MDNQLRRYFVGTAVFAFVVTWATIGPTVAVVALIGCAAAVNLQRLQRTTERRHVRSQPKIRRPRTTLATRPLRAEDIRQHQLVPDDPSLILTP